MFSGILLSEKVGVGDKGSGDTTTVDVLAPLEDLLNMSLRYACFTNEAFFSW